MAMVLLVEDDEDIAEAVKYNLERDGHGVRVCTHGADALRRFERSGADIVVLDLMLPDMSGLEVCRRIRALHAGRQVPVLMLTARGEEYDRITGFEAGADDYVVKPFSMKELLLRVAALVRRAARGEIRPGVLRYGTVEIDPDSHRVLVGGREVRLTALEFRLLLTLVERRGRVQSRERLLSDVWGIDAADTPRPVDTHIRRLREKLGPAAVYIETLRGAGYRFASD